jgi:hypothetical protein
LEPRGRTLTSFHLKVFVIHPFIRMRTPISSTGCPSDTGTSTPTENCFLITCHPSFLAALCGGAGSLSDQTKVSNCVSTGTHSCPSDDLEIGRMAKPLTT